MPPSGEAAIATDFNDEKCLTQLPSVINCSGDISNLFIAYNEKTERFKRCNKAQQE